MSTIAAARFSVLRSRSGAIGVAVLAVVVVVALVGPFVAPHRATEPVGAPFAAPSGEALLGTDFLGRDVVSRVLSGGRTVLGLGGLVALLAYTGGLTVGLVAGYTRSLVDPILMRTVDVVLSFPGLIFMLLLITAMGTGTLPLVIGATIVQIPSIARIIRTATLEQSVRGFVEAAAARGEKTTTILWREIVPNIAGPIAADAGLRLTYSVLIIASVNFLGLGLQPPTSDWGLMVSENRGGIGINPWAVFAPAAFIAVLTVSLNLVADRLSGLRDIR